METLEHTLQAIFDNAAIGLAQISLDGKWLRVNKRYCEILGYSEAELRTKTLKDITHPDDCSEVLAARHQLLEGTISSHSMEKRYIRKDGSVFWGRLNRSLVRDHDNSPKFFVAVVEDITEKVKVERSLRERDQQFALAQTAAGLGVWSRDLRTNVTLTSGHYGRLRGLEAESGWITHEEWLELIHPTDRGRVERALRECIERTHIWDEEFRVVWPDGSTHWLRVKGQVYLDDAGRPIQLAGVSLDTTDRKRAEEQRLGLASIVESCEDAIFSKNLDGTIENWNSGAEKIFGYSADEIIGRPVSLLLPLEGSSEFPNILARIRAGARLEHYEVTRMRKDGSRVDLSLSVSPIKDAGGTIIGSSTIARDITDRKRADATLRRSEERFRFAQLAGRIGTFDWDLETGVHTWTPELEAMYRLPPGGCPPTPTAWITLLHPEDRERILQRVVESFEAGTPVEADWRIIWPDQTIHWLTGRWQVIKDAAGKPLRMMGVNIDISDRKRIEEALRQSEERFRLAIQATNDAIWDIDLRTGMVSWNETYTALYGRPPETSNSWQWWIDRIHPGDRQRTVDGLREAISSDASSWTCEYRFRRADGEWAYIYDRAYVSRNASGQPWRVIGAMQDLTVRKQAEAAQREIDRQYKDVFENISISVFLVDVVSGGRFQFVGFNPAAEVAIGLSNTEIAGKFVDDVFPKTLADKLNANYRRCLDAEQAIQFDEVLDLPQGRRYFHVNLIPLRDTDGVTKRIIRASIDTTALKRTQEEALAKQNLESLGVLAGGIAHDFNNVLGGIIAQTELIEADLAAGSEMQTEIQKIKAAATRGSEIVRELMIYAGQEEAYQEAIDMSQLIRETLGLLGVSVSKHAVLRTELADHLPGVLGNAAQMRQVLMNLVINASEAIGFKDGVITLRTALERCKGDPSPDRSLELAPGDYIRLEISDTGSGIPEEAKARIFDPFFTTKFAGRGMGLAVVNKIVHDHGGHISMVSVPGQGTTFRVVLPCTAKMASEKLLIADPVLPRERNQRGTILVVDDEELLRKAVSKSLQKRGFSVLEASNGSRAIQLLHESQDDLDAVLLDVTLPGISSQEVLEEGCRIRPDLKVVITSAYSKELVNSTFPKMPVRHFIRKPFRLDDLVQLLTAEDGLSTAESLIERQNALIAKSPTGDG